MFVWRKDKQVKYLEISEFKKHGIKAIFTSRLGGVSTGNYSSLNLGLHTRDKKSNVIVNRKIIAQTLGLNYRDFVAGEQVHGNRIKVVKDDDKGRGALNYEDSISGVDGLITDTNNLPLISFYADCVPLLLADIKNKVIGLAHAGWKGTYLKIGVEAIKKMQKYFNTRPEDCLIGIGPSISRENYEVDNRVINKFKESFSYWKDLVTYKGKGHYLLDLWTANKQALVEIGVPDSQIIISNYCTYKDNDYFYSYRKEGGKTGRMASIITL